MEIQKLFVGDTLASCATPMEEFWKKTGYFAALA